MLNYRDITFPQTEHLALGRNGFTTCCGITVSVIAGEVFLEPRNNRGVGKARLVIPMSHVEALRTALADALDPTEPRGIR